jgi:hypothetical protein
MTGVQVAATYPESVRGWTGLNCATPLYRQLSRACFASESPRTGALVHAWATLLAAQKLGSGK